MTLPPVLVDAPSSESAASSGSAGMTAQAGHKEAGPRLPLEMLRAMPAALYPCETLRHCIHAPPNCLQTTCKWDVLAGFELVQASVHKQARKRVDPHRASTLISALRGWTLPLAIAAAILVMLHPAAVHSGV
jgi:hypothetical protein